MLRSSLLIVLLVSRISSVSRAESPESRPHKVIVYELSNAPIAFAPSWWYSGWWRDNAGETKNDAIEDPIKMVRRFAHIARGDTYGMRFWNPQARREANKSPGSLLVLDRETLGDRIYEACRAARQEAPGLKITVFGFENESNPTFFDLPLNRAVEAMRPYYEKEMLPNLDCVDSVNCTYYLGADTAKPKDDVRDATNCIKRLDTFLLAYRKLLPPGTKLATTIWPRLLFTEGSPTNFPGREIPPHLVPDYIKTACQADEVFLFDLKPTDKAFIAELAKYCPPSVAPAKPK